MSKTSLYALVLVVVAVGGILFFSARNEEQEAPVVEAVSETPTAAEEVMDKVTEDVGKAIEEASDAVEEMAEDVVETVEDAAEEAEEVAEELSDAVTSDVESKVEAAQEAIEEALDDAAETEAEAAGDPDVLSVEGYDMEGVLKLIDDAGMDQLKSTTLKALLTKAEDNPDLLEGALEQVRKALGL